MLIIGAATLGVDGAARLVKLGATRGWHRVQSANASEPRRQAMPAPPQQPTPIRRVSARKGLRCPLTLVLPDKIPRQGTACDLSSDGLSFRTARPIAPGTRCEVRFELTLGDRSVPVQAVIKTVYSSFGGAEGFRIGAVFTDVDPASVAALAEFSG